MLADGVRHLDPASAVFEAMLEGWATQQRARFLKVSTTGHGWSWGGGRGIRNQYPWQWESAEAEAFITHSPVAVSTARNYQNTLRLFCGYASDARYGWAAKCLEHFGSAPRQILDEWNTDLFQTSDLVPLLAERGIHLSREQVYRLVTQVPQRLSTDTLAALCDILECQQRPDRDQGRQQAGP